MLARLRGIEGKAEPQLPAARYWVITSAGIRPRAEIVMLLDLAQARTALVSTAPVDVEPRA